MSKITINILCPSGHRRKAQLMPNNNLFQVLEDMCNQENLDSSEWALMYQHKKCDLTIPWRLQNIPTNATLEMSKLEDRRHTDDINVHLQLPDNSRYSGWFEPTVTLQEMLDWYRIQPESMVAAIDISMSDTFNSCPICTYMSEEIIGEYALSNTSLRDLGLTSGSAVIRYHLRPITDDELQKINNRIDDKIVRRRQQQHQQKEQSKQQTTTQPTPVRSNNSSTSSRNSAAASSNNEEYSIFNDPPTRTSVPDATTQSKQRQSRTLAEELGINISLDPESKFEQEQSKTNFRNFKFPATTKGRNLYQNESDEDYQRTQKVKPCERRPIAYDVTKTRSIREKKDTKSGEVSDNFYELTAEDLRSVLNGLHQQGSDEQPLETRSMRERAQTARHMSYEQIAIRFVINSRYILQGFFRPEEPTSRLLEFAQTHIVCSQIGQTDFYFYTTPPRVVLSDLRQPLSTYDLAPAAYVHLGHRTISPLNVQLASNIPIRTIDEANQLASQYVFSRSRPMSERERELSNTLSNERPTTATTLMNRPTTRNHPTTGNLDDKQLREKLRKFLPGKK
ncbi:unnamed protein product [Adineta steineri]|uniref:TUG ubiquitin-like domain-containing protein n=2 Tax=Adineta steineri TaxID=433720 RepID=A0A818G3H1_9BILA|nr:unnamed protein product [Adineta steineri]